MIVKLVPRIGGAPLVLDAASFVVCQDNGTPIAAGGEYGPDGAQYVSMVGQKDFQRVLRVLGVNTTVVVDTLKPLRPQPGARLIADPDNP